MNKAELIEALAQRSGLQKQKAKKLLDKGRQSEKGCLLFCDLSKL